jgi:Family of unknown function (DUF6445)
VFTENFKIQAAPLYGGAHAFVIDNALADPDALVQFAIRTHNAFARSALASNPGVELRMVESFNAKFDNFFRLHIRRFFDARRTLGAYTRLSMTTLRSNELHAPQWLPHRDDQGLPPDECIVACMLYLFKNDSLGGTGFYVPKVPLQAARRLAHDCGTMPDDVFAETYRVKRGYCTASNDYFELAQVVPSRYNRLVFYDGAAFHTAHLTAPEKLVNDPENGRLTLNGFFRCKRHSNGFADRTRG